MENLPEAPSPEPKTLTEEEYYNLLSVIPCKKCGQFIKQARIDILGPGTDTCILHSEAKPYVAIINGTAEGKMADIIIEKDPSLIEEYAAESSTKS